MGTAGTPDVVVLPAGDKKQDILNFEFASGDTLEPDTPAISFCDSTWEKGPFHSLCIFCIDVVATTPKNNSPDKKFVFVSVVSPTLCAYTHAKFERVEVLLNGQARYLKTAI